jgi:KTSC domain-containing protein
MQVDSGHIEDVSWQDGTLYIVFKDQSKYAYADVPSGVFQEFLAAPSKSQFFRTEIKGVYEYERLA